MPSIGDLPPGERPRERLDALGPEALTGCELVALLVGSGGRWASALSIADEVLASVAGSLRTLGSISPSAIAAIPGVGMAIGARIAAALELGRRASTEIRHPGDRVHGP
jgi:DNA repair protein RadC